MKQIMKLIPILILLNLQVFADVTGSASIFTFFNGMALENNEVLVDNSYKQYTDDDGCLELILEVGTHQIEIFAKDENGANLGYVKKIIEIKDSRDTQLIATFNEDGTIPYVEIDTPVGNAVPKIDTTNQLATLNGVVVTSDKKTPIKNARVFVKGTSIDVKTNDKGEFSVSISAETNVSISVVHSEYSAATIDNIFLKKDEKITKTIELTPASMELEEFIVLAPKVQGSIVSVMAEEKESKAIMNIIGSDTMSKKGDSDAAGALKRVTGVTLIGSNVYVRGLGGRYSNVEMNSLPLPSPDIQRRTVPLDIFPSAVIGSMQVQKSATADIPASFGGGYVNIRTKDKSKENYIKISTEIKGNSNTGKMVDTYEGSATDWKGQDDGYRSIPGILMEDSKIVVGEVAPSLDPLKQQEYTTSLANRLLTTRKSKLPYGGKISLEGAYNFDIADKHELSVFANYGYGQDHTTVREEYKKYEWEAATNYLYKDATLVYGNVTRTKDKYTNSGMLNMSYNYANVFKLKYTKIYSQISEKVTKVLDGWQGSNPDYSLIYDLNWEERTLDMNQLNSEMKYEVANYENTLSMGYEKGTANLNQPANVAYQYEQFTDPSRDPIYNNYKDTEFLNLTSDDEMSAYYVKNKTNVDLVSQSDYIELGVSSSTKSREAKYNKFVLDRLTTAAQTTDDIDTIYDESIRQNYDGSISTTISFVPSYWYDAEIEQDSYYINTFLKPAKKLEMIVGFRKESFKQTIFSYTNLVNGFQDALAPIRRDPTTLNFQDLLPNLGLKYIFDEKNQINFAYSQTYIVPDIREFVDVEYRHPYDSATVKGNPDLVNTDISNYDLKYSHYFSDTENINFGLFYKQLDKPIEDGLLQSSSLPRYSYINSDEAKLYGFEIDGRKSFDILHNTLKNFYFSGNFSYTKSKVTLTEEQKTEYTTQNRGLQGLSPTILNASLSYEKKGRSVTLSYNKMGERIRKLGNIDADEKWPDIYEVPPQIVDFVWIENFSNGMSVKLRLKNLLDEETIWYQGSEDRVRNRYKLGREYSFAVSYKY